MLINFCMNKIIIVLLLSSIILLSGCTITTDKCRDNVCGDSESCATCPEDCGYCEISCGDGTCNADETCASCEDDCGQCITGAYCGDDNCDNNEYCDTCSSDCGICAPYCGDNNCDADEDCSSCTDDCGACITSGKQQLLNMVKEVYDAKELADANKEKGEVITFDANDAVTYTEVARHIGVYTNRIVFSCSPNYPNLAPPTELGCASTGITPTAEAQAYVFVNCVGDSTICQVDFSKV